MTPSTHVVQHKLTNPEAHAICAVLHAVSHIDVRVLVEETDGVVNVSPIGHALAVFEEVSVLRAIFAVTDAPVFLLPVVA
jgi:hypothetical protein